MLLPITISRDLSQSVIFVCSLVSLSATKHRLIEFQEQQQQLWFAVLNQHYWSDCKLSIHIKVYQVYNFYYHVDTERCMRSSRLEHAKKKKIIFSDSFYAHVNILLPSYTNKCISLRLKIELLAAWSNLSCPYAITRRREPAMTPTLVVDILCALIEFYSFALLCFFFLSSSSLSLKSFSSFIT